MSSHYPRTVWTEKNIEEILKKISVLAVLRLLHCKAGKEYEHHTFLTNSEAGISRFVADLHDPGFRMFLMRSYILKGRQSVVSIYDKLDKISEAVRK
jgi:hypothetical protein